MIHVHSTSVSQRKNLKGKRQRRRWVGPWLRGIREGGPLDQTDMGKKLGRDQSYVSRLEAGLGIITADDLPRVLRAYGVTPAQFAEQARTA
jgi:transcriptional regulator with XRE-family HTH domain